MWGERKFNAVFGKWVILTGVTACTFFLQQAPAKAQMQQMGEEQPSCTSVEAVKAREFAHHLQETVKNSDIGGIYAYVDDDSITGPIRGTVEKVGFEQVFSKDWVESFLTIDPGCQQDEFGRYYLKTKREGYNELGIKYVFDAQLEPNITKLYGLIQEKQENIVHGLIMNNQLVSPFCFFAPLWSFDHLETYVEYKNIINEQKFFLEPGLFYGKEITEAEMKPLGVFNYYEQSVMREIKLFNRVTECSSHEATLSNKGGEISVRGDFHDQASYKILKKMPLDFCKTLAPKLSEYCMDVYLAKVDTFHGGTVGWKEKYGIYGLFDLPDLGETIVPIRFFRHYDHMLTYYSKVQYSLNISTDVGWHIDNQVLSPACFFSPGWTGDVLEEYAKQYDIIDQEAFYRQPGKYFGTEISDFSGIYPFWDEEEKINILTPIETCLPHNYRLLEENEGVYYRISYFDQGGYQKVKDMPLEKCAAYAPDIGYPCLDAAYVMDGYFTGGSAGWYMAYGAHGIFDLPELGKTIVPLRFFENHSDMAADAEKQIID